MYIVFNSRCFLTNQNKEFNNGGIMFYILLNDILSDKLRINSIIFVSNKWLGWFLDVE